MTMTTSVKAANSPKKPHQVRRSDNNREHTAKPSDKSKEKKDAA